MQPANTGKITPLFSPAIQNTGWKFSITSCSVEPLAQVHVVAAV